MRNDRSMARRHWMKELCHDSLSIYSSDCQLPEVNPGGLRSTYVSSTDESYVPSGLDNIRNVNNCLILE